MIRRKRRLVLWKLFLKLIFQCKRAASREFLVNSLKVGDEASSTTLSDVMSAQDMKYIMEGGGGVMGDPIVLVQKYFGPRIAEMVPVKRASSRRNGNIYKKSYEQRRRR